VIALSIVERELRVQSRRPYTVWLRVGIGLVAGLAGLTMLLWIEGTASAMRGGQQLLQGLGWSALVFGMIEGVRQTADSISHEKREGTLGLLFLTDLRGLDVVLGKLAAHALNLLYALMAAFPILGLAIGAGGVTAGEFWRLQLVLLDTVFLAAAGGLWSSARSHGDQEALLRASALVAALTLLPALACLLPLVQTWPSPSPGVLMVSSGDIAYRANPGRFWLSLLAVHAAAWGLLIWGGRMIEARGRETLEPAQPPRAPAPEEAGWPYRVPPSLHSRRRVRGGVPTLADDPAGWLAWRRAPSRLLVWVALLLLPLSGSSAFLLWRGLGVTMAGGLAGLSVGVQVLTALAPAALLGLAASRRMTDLHHSGALESLLCTPIPGARLALAEWNVLWRVMRWPLAVQGLLLALPALLLLGSVSHDWLDWATHLAGIAKTMLTEIASVWLALWFGLRARATTPAVGRTVFWAVLVPWLGRSVLSFLLAWSGALTFMGGVTPWVYYALQLFLYGLGIAYAAGLIHWARRQLLTRFRQAATGPSCTPGRSALVSAHEALAPFGFRRAGRAFARHPGRCRADRDAGQEGLSPADSRRHHAAAGVPGTPGSEGGNGCQSRPAGAGHGDQWRAS